MTPQELLISGAKEFGLALSEEQIRSFFVFFSELKKWNKKINLTTIREDRDIVVKHGLDSIAYIKGFTLFPGLKLLDMGSGAGFPALPIKIAYPEIEVALTESVKKKASFLRHIIRLLTLRAAAVFDKRIDQLPRSLLASFDVVTARAFANMKTALAAGMPYLKPGGIVVLSRGSEETISDHEAAQVGVNSTKRIELILPYSDYKRAIWVFKKRG